MSWLIALGVLAFMLAPLIWILPNPRQQHQTRLREVARRCGLQVRVVALPQTRRQRVRREPEQRLVSYTRPITTRRPGAPWKLWLQEGGDEEGALAGDSSLQAVVAANRSRFPDDALLLEYTGLGLSLYWRERGADADTVEQLSRALNDIVNEAQWEVANVKKNTDAG